MKRNLLLAAILVALTSNAYATDRGNNQSTPSNSADASSLAVAGALASSSAYSASGAIGLGGAAYSAGGNSSTSVNVQGDNNDRIIPASSAIAPNVATSVICPIVSPTSHAAQFLVFGGSTTGSQSLNGICVAYHLGQTAVVERMACNKDKDYAKANPNCSVK